MYSGGFTGGVPTPP